MAVDTLTEIYAQDMVDYAVINESLRKSVLWNAGVIAVDPKLAKLVAAGEGRKISRVGWNDLPDPLLTGNATQATTHNPGYADDSATNIIPNANSNYMYDAVKCMTNHAMGQREIIKAVSFVEDPVGALNGRVSNYWARYFDMYATSMLVGVFNDNDDNDSNDMIIGDGTDPVDENILVDGFGTLGDAAEFGTGVMIVHSNTAKVLRKAQLIDTIPSAENSAVNFEYFQGVRMLVSDNVPVKNNGATDTCISILIQGSPIMFGNSDANIIPSEIWYDPRVGVGSGETQLFTRQDFSMHVEGFSWLDATVTGSVASGSIPGLTSTTKLWPCPADMQLAANWNRVLPRKAIKIAYVWTSETGSGITA